MDDDDDVDNDDGDDDDGGNGDSDDGTYGCLSSVNVLHFFFRSEELSSDRSNEYHSNESDRHREGSGESEGETPVGGGMENQSNETNEQTNKQTKQQKEKKE